MKPVKIKTKTCQCCGETISDEDVADFENHGLEDDEDPHYQCSECGDIYAERDDAKECCK